MFTDNLSGALANAMIPTQSIIGPAHAWALLVALLVLSCGALWFLSKPPRDAFFTSHHPTHPGPGGGRRHTRVPIRPRPTTTRPALVTRHRRAI
jgi:hypothetical protein